MIGSLLVHVEDVCKELGFRAVLDDLQLLPQECRELGNAPRIQGEGRRQTRLARYSGSDP